MRNNKTLLTQYSFLMVLVSAEAGCISGFAAVYLENHGFKNLIVGFLLAFGNLGGAVLSPILGSVIDKSKRINAFSCLISMLLVKVFLEALLLLFMKNLHFIGICFGILLMLSTAAVPIVTDLCFEIDPKRKSIDYGFSRSCGSFSYAIVTLLLGYICMDLSVDVLPSFEIIIAILQILILLLIFKNKEVNTEREESVKQQPLSLFGFVLRNRKFIVFSMGLMLLNFSACIPGAFLINVVSEIGGKISDVGIITSIAAFVEVPIMMFYSRISKKILSVNIVKIASVMYVIKAFVYVYASNVNVLYFASLLQAVSYAPIAPAMVEYSSVVVDSKDIAKSQTVIAGIFTLGNVLASQFGGILFDIVSIKTSLFYALLASIIGTIVCFSFIEKKNFQ